MTPTTTTPSMKLLVDTRSQRVLCDEAGDDAVDFLFSLLNLPGCGDGSAGVGSVINLCTSAAAKKLDVASSVGRGGREAAPAPQAAPAGGMMYTVMDDLRIAPMSTVSVITRLSELGIKDIGALQEKTVQLGYAEGLEMLKASLQSKTVLTDVFIGKKKSWKFGLPSKIGVAKLFCGFLALPVMCALVELVTQGPRVCFCIGSRY